MEDGFLHPPITLLQTLEESFELLSIKLIDLLLSTNGDDNLLLERLDVGEDASKAVQPNNPVGGKKLATLLNFKEKAFGYSDRDKRKQFLVSEWSTDSLLPTAFHRRLIEESYCPVVSLRLRAFGSELILHNYDV